MNTSKNDQKTVTVYSAGTRVDAMIAKSMLDEANIGYVVRGEGVQELGGAGSFGNFNPLFGPILIQVLEEDADRAREVLQPLNERAEVVDEDMLIHLAEQAEVNGEPEE